MTRMTQAAVVFATVFAAAQLVRPERVNPPIDPSRAIQAHASSGLAAILERSCADCHSNGTAWDRYTQIAPVSWLIVRGVAEGRRVVNFSEWGGYTPDARRQLLAQSCRAVSSGRMPGMFTLLRPEARLSAADIETICAAARQADLTAKTASSN